MQFLDCENDDVGTSLKGYGLLHGERKATLVSQLQAEGKKTASRKLERINM